MVVQKKKKFSLRDTMGELSKKKRGKKKRTIFRNATGTDTFSKLKKKKKKIHKLLFKSGRKKRKAKLVNS